MAYLNFAPYLAEGAEVVLSEKTKAIVSFALCGFANFLFHCDSAGRTGIVVSAARHARFGLKAVLAATLSNLMSATIAGLFLSLKRQGTDHVDSGNHTKEAGRPRLEHG